VKTASPSEKHNGGDVKGTLIEEQDVRTAVPGRAA
jgi:hypothetical protein